jgi:hypothetical protein
VATITVGNAASLLKIMDTFLAMDVVLQLLEHVKEDVGLKTKIK